MGEVRKFTSLNNATCWKGGEKTDLKLFHVGGKLYAYYGCQAIGQVMWLTQTWLAPDQSDTPEGENVRFKIPVDEGQVRSLGMRG